MSENHCRVTTIDNNDRPNINNNNNKYDDEKSTAAAAASEVADQEEEALLESLQATRQDKDIYEDQVIRQATHQLAPTLKGFNGFPSLDTLMHSNSFLKRPPPSADLPHLHAVLSKIRKSLQQESPGDNQQRRDLLHLKEQLLLEYMQTVAGVPKEDLPLRKDEDHYLLRRKMAEEEERQRQKKNGATPRQDRDGKWRRVSFAPEGGAENAAKASNVPRRLGRVSIMKRKEMEQPTNGNRATAARGEPREEESQERRDELKRLRIQRQKRKAARRKAWAGDGGFGSVEEEQESQDETQKGSENGTATVDGTDEDAKQNTPKDNEIGMEIEDEKKIPEVEANNYVGKPPAGAAAPPLTCPICQAQLECAGEEDNDALLSTHISLCQQEEGPSTRRSSRLRENKRPNYAEVDDKKDDDSRPEENAVSTTQERKSSTKKRKRANPPPPKPTQPSLDDLEEWVYEDRVDEWLENGIGKMRKMAELDSNSNDGNNTNSDDVDSGEQDLGGGLVIPAWIYDRLFGYQRDGLRIMWGWHQQEAGGILGDEMGLGKTVSAAAFLGSLVSCRKVDSVLFVVPATLLNHWLTELSTWAPGLRRILIHQSGEVDNISRTITPKLLSSLDKWLRMSRSNRINECIDADDRATLPPHSFCGTGYAIITTYENVRRNPDVYTNHNFSYVVLDEAQKIHNPDADITQACKRIRTPHRISMSGTPISNNLKELWSLFDFVFPGRLGTLPAFEQEFAEPIRRGGYSNASPMQVQLAYRCAVVLRDLIEPYLLRRLKKDVKEVSRMPSKKEHVLFCRLSPSQRALYEAYLRSDDVENVVRGSGNLLKAVTMLRKICNHSDLICQPSGSAMEKFIKDGFANCVGTESSDDDEYQADVPGEDTLAERSGKLEVLSKILPLWKKQGHRVLIFCQWRKMLTIVQRFIMSNGWKFARLDGNTNVASRQRLVDEFNTDESYFAMLCTTRTGGVGLNLTGASRVCLYSPDWNPQIDAQARERAWRFGQKKEVTVYRLITAGTIEEKIYQRQIFKTALSNKVLQDPRQKRLFSQRDLRDLFTLKQDTGSINSGADGVTETGEMTRGGGVVDVDDPKEEGENLKDVMKSRGLAGIFDHDFVEGTSSSKTASVIEMEEHAKKVAREAMKALRDSVAAVSQSAPGGGAAAEPRRFGGSALFQAPRPGGQPGSASRGLLDSLNQQSASVQSAGTMTGEAESNMSEYTQLLKRIKVFVRRQKPSTNEILEEFSDVEDAAIFRSLLKSVANLKDGRWFPKA